MHINTAKTLLGSSFTAAIAFFVYTEAYLAAVFFCLLLWGILVKDEEP